MNKNFYLFCLALPFICHSQEKLSELKSPTSPASSIINLTPTEVLNPKSYEALETAVFSNFSDENGNTIIPNDFAIEFSPYWFNSRLFTSDEYLNPDFLTQILRTSSISIASTQNFLIGDDLTNSLGIGYRNSIFIPSSNDENKLKKFFKSYGPSSQLKNDLVSEATKHINKTPDKFQELMAPVIEAEIDSADMLFSKKNVKRNILTRIKGLDPSDPDFLTEFNNILDEEIGTKNAYENFSNYLDNRSGLYIDFAYALSLNFPTTKFDYSYVPKQGVWITPRLSISEKFKLLGVLRYEWFNLNFHNKYFPENNVYQNNLDYGLAIDFKVNKFNLNLELVGRTSQSKVFVQDDDQGNALYRDDSVNDLQYIGSINYNLTEQIILTYSLGSKFKPILNSNQTLVSLLSLNFGFGGPTTQQIVGN